MIDSELFYDAVDLLKSLIATPRVSRDETGAATLVEQWMAARDLDPVRVANNIYSIDPEFDPRRPTVLLNSHIDTVNIVEGWTRDPHDAATTPDGRIYGIGSNDAGASLVSLLAVYTTLISTPRAVNFIFLASAEEEVSGNNGISCVLPRLGKIDLALVGEPTGMRPAIAEKGLMVLDGVVTGIAGHAARDEGTNAIFKALPVVDRLRNIHFEKVSPTLGPIKITVTGIHAGERHNVVPGECRLMVDVRTTDAYTNEETLEIITRGAGPDVTLTPRSTRLQPSSIDPAHPIVSRASILGLEPFGSPTLSDQALIPFPSLKMGPGDSARSHTPDEFITVDELREAMDIYTTILTGLRL